jgi:hypothetical protein
LLVDQLELAIEDLEEAQAEQETKALPSASGTRSSKRKGLWRSPPLGYQMKDSKIAIVEAEAERVRLIWA